MASTISMTSPIEEPIKGVRRSRFSFHLNTPRVRRWLLVQLVSVPVEEVEEETDPQLISHAQSQAEARRPDKMRQLVDSYRNNQLLHSLL